MLPPSSVRLSRPMAHRARRQRGLVSWMRGMAGCPPGVERQVSLSQRQLGGAHRLNKFRLACCGACDAFLCQSLPIALEGERQEARVGLVCLHKEAGYGWTATTTREERRAEEPAIVRLSVARTV